MTRSGSALAEKAPYEFGLAYIVEVVDVQSGGLKEGTGVMDNLDLTLTVDTEQAWNLLGGTLFLYALANQGDDVNAENLGSTQGVDNIERFDATKLYEAMYEQSFNSASLPGMRFEASF